MIQSKKLLMNNMVTLTVSTSPVSVDCTLTYNNMQYSTKSLTVPKGSSIAYSIYHSTYGTTSGSIIMDDDKTLTCTGTYSTEYISSSWTRPNLSSNGTLGGTSFAVYSNSQYSNNTQAWEAFDGTGKSTSSYYQGKKADNPYLIWYNPDPLNITSITYMNLYQNAGNETPKSGYIYGSNTNGNWSTITSYSNSTATNYGTWSVNLSGNNSFYKYHKMTFAGLPNTSTYVACTELYLTGNKQITSYTYYWNTSIT